MFFFGRINNYATTCIILNFILVKEILCENTAVNNLLHNLSQSDFKQKFDNYYNCSSSLGQINEFQTIPLLSIAGSGNTWIRFLIEQATGYATGSVYNDKSLLKKFKGENAWPSQKQSIVVKAHVWPRITNFLNETGQVSVPGCIFILRNPKDSLLAEYTRRLTNYNHTQAIGFQELKNHIKNSTKNYNDFQKSITAHAKKFRNLYRRSKFCQNNQRELFETSESKIESFILFYEDLKSSSHKLIEIMKNLVRYLNEKNSDHQRIFFREDCLLRNHEGFYHRRHSKKDAARIDREFLKMMSDESKSWMRLAVSQVNISLEGTLPESYSIYR